jgi:hypothetical protein
VLINGDGSFTYDDVKILWEIKSSNELNKPKVIANMILKAAEVFRFQWHRQFVLGFLICGTSFRMFRFERSGVFIGRHVDFNSNATALIKCMVAGLILPDSKVGFLEDIESLTNGNGLFVVSVDGQKFELGDQIIGPRRDHLVSRATVVHRAHPVGDNSKQCCFKTAWQSWRRISNSALDDGRISTGTGSRT